MATLAKRFRSIAAPHIAACCFDVTAADLCQSVESPMSSSTRGDQNGGGLFAPPAKKKRKKNGKANGAHAQGGDYNSTGPAPSSARLLSYRAAGALALAVEHLEDPLEGDRFDLALPKVLAALTFDKHLWDSTANFADYVHRALAPAIAALALKVQDMPKRRDLTLKLMLLARDGTTPTRKAALAAVKHICEALNEDVADFANQMVQGIAESIDDPDTAKEARAIVILVENNTGIRLV